MPNKCALLLSKLKKIKTSNSYIWPEVVEIIEDKNEGEGGEAMLWRGKGLQIENKGHRGCSCHHHKAWVKDLSPGRCLTLLLRAPCKMLTACIRVPRIESWLHSWFQHLANADTRRQQITAQVAWSPPPRQETWNEFLTLAGPTPTTAGSEPVDGSSCSICLCLTVSQINLKKKKDILTFKKPIIWVMMKDIDNACYQVGTIQSALNTVSK